MEVVNFLKHLRIQRWSKKISLEPFKECHCLDRNSTEISSRLMKDGNFLKFQFQAYQEDLLSHLGVQRY